MNNYANKTTIVLLIKIENKELLMNQKPFGSVPLAFFGGGGGGGACCV